jgi:hypothetical protein
MIELGYVSEHDEYGIHDGRKLARQLIADAYKMLIPYANACPHCAEDLFAAVSGQAIEAIRREGMQSIVLWDRKPGLDKPTATAAHLRSAQAHTAELLVAMPKHEHRS